MAGIRKQSNKVTTAISYSRTEALTGWAIIGFSLYMLSYLRGRRKERIIEQRLNAIERERGRGREDELLAIGNGDEGNGDEGNGDEGNAAGVLAIGNAPAPGGAGASSLSSNSNSNSGSSSNIIDEDSDNLGAISSFHSLNYKPSSMSNASSALTSNASSALTSNAISAAPRGNKSPGGRFKGKEERKPGYGSGNSGGRRTRRRSRQTKKRRMRVKRRQTRKLRRNTKRRRM
jgi:hypothetical protein